MQEISFFPKKKVLVFQRQNRHADTQRESESFEIKEEVGAATGISGSERRASRAPPPGPAAFHSVPWRHPRHRVCFTGVIPAGYSYAANHRHRHRHARARLRSPSLSSSARARRDMHAAACRLQCTNAARTGGPAPLSPTVASIVRCHRPSLSRGVSDTVMITLS